MVKIAES